MASTPSASALSAVLRCRRNIWTRNPPSKRPSASVRGLGPAGGPLRDPPERSASTQASAWEAVPQGESVAVIVGGTLTVSYREGGRVSREKSKFRDPRLWQAPGDAVQRERPGRLPGQSAFVKDASGLPAGVLKLSVTSCPGFLEGRVPGFVPTGWSALKSACLSLTASTTLLLNLCGSGSPALQAQTPSMKKPPTERPQHQK